MATESVSQTSTAAQEWKRRWPLVLAAVVGFSFHSVMTAFAGLFIGPVGEEFGWSRTQVTAGLSLSSVTVTILSPFFGVLIDRWGTRRLALPGLVMKSLVMAGFALVSASVTQWFAIWFIYALASLAVKSTIWTTAVAGVFEAGRGLALGVVMSGTAFAQILVPPLGNWLIEEFGWRGAFAWMGLGWGGIAFVFCVLFLFDAHDDARKAKAAGESETAKVDLPGLTISQAWRDPALWRIAISTFVMMLFTIALVVHQIPILEEADVSRTNAAWLASLAGAAGIAGKLVTGRLLDSFNPNLVGGITLAAASIGFALLLEPFRTLPLIFVAMLINGYASGTKLQICAYLTSRYAGLKYFGTIFSVMASLIALGSGLGPVLGGIAYDMHGDYAYLLIGGIAGSLLSAAMILTLGPYPDWSEGKESGRQAPAGP
ncbi:MAG: MFS transporter [Novosphingobium sp.]|nr:MFS transporter [Novosphingobium sp.]MCP5403893.1 MFS transporter [Novosphingobium sp.]